MSKICGLEIKGNDVIIVVLEGEPGSYKIIPTDFKRISLHDSKKQEDVKSFNKAIVSFFIDSGFDKIGIKERASKGKFAGGAATFKIEGLIQNTDFPVQLIHSNTLKSKLKDRDLDFSGINQYQIEAMKVAYCLLLN